MTGQGESDFDGGALSGTAGDLSLSAEESSAIADADESQSIGRDRVVVEAVAVVGDDQFQFGWRGVDRDSGRRLTAVPEGVGESFLDDAIEDVLGQQIDVRERSIAVDLDVKRFACRPFLDKIVDRGHQVLFIEDQGAEVADQPSPFGHRFAHQMADSLELVAIDSASVVELREGRFGVELGGHEVLNQAIVQVIR